MEELACDKGVCTASDSKKKRDKIIHDNMGLVHRYARKTAFDVPYEDRVSAGIEGLLLAADQFDEAKGFAFSTYASIRIRERIQNESLHWLGVNVPSRVAKSVMSKTGGSHLKDDERCRAESVLAGGVASFDAIDPQGSSFGFDGDIEKQVDFALFLDQINEVFSAHFSEDEIRFIKARLDLDGGGGMTSKEASCFFNERISRIRYQTERFYRLMREQLTLS